MARVRDAAAASGWTEELWRLPLMQFRYIADNKNPAIILQRMPLLRQELAAHGVRLSWAQCLMLRFQDKDAAAKVAKLQSAMDSLPISLDYLHVLTSAPTLMLLSDLRSVLGRRVAAMQLLYPQLDLERVIHAQPILLTLTEEALAARWASLQKSCGLCDDDIRALVQHQPRVLTLSPGVIGWRVQQLQAYESSRELAGATSATFSSWGRVLSAASYRVWRLRYLSVAANTRYEADTWVSMNEERFAALSPGYSSWLASSPIPSQAYRDGHA